MRQDAGMPSKLSDKRYQMLQRLGEGAMGAVFQVEENATGQTLAMKVLSRSIEGDEQAYLLLKQEFRLMTQLRHPNCCAVYDYGLLENGSPFLTMELVPGRGLDEILPVPLEEIRPILGQLLLALGYIHQMGYVHSDVKAANIRIKPDGTVKLMDYGLMEPAGRSGSAIKGTLGYLAPEIVKRGHVDQRADLYAVGALAYELATGRLPFVNERVVDVLRMHLHEPVPPFPETQARIDPKLESVIHKLLKKSPQERYQSAYEVLEDLGIEVPVGIGGTLLNPPMIGRSQLLSEMAHGVSQLKAEGTGGIVLLKGEAGIGKGRLLEEVRSEVQLAEIVWISGAFRGTPEPYGPFVELLRHLLPLARLHVPDTLERLAPVLMKLWAEVGENRDGLPIQPAPDLDPPSREKFRLQDSFTALIAELADAAGGLVLALDGWHRADRLSGELLAHLLRTLTGAPVLLFLSTQAIPEPHPDWVQSSKIHTLNSLSVAEVGQMVCAMLGTKKVSEHFLRHVVNFSNGNPLQVEQLIEHLVRERKLTSAKGQWNTDIELTPADLPSDRSAMLARRLELLPENVRILAGHASILGESFSLQLLKETGNQSDEDLFDGLRSLAASQILKQDTEGQYRFVEADLQRHLAETVMPQTRLGIHQAALDVLQKIADGTPLPQLPLELITALATHSLKADIIDCAIPYALEAGQRHSALFALEAAEQFYNQGLALLRKIDNENSQTFLLSYLSALAQVYRSQSKNKEAKEMQAEAIDLAELLGESRKLGQLLGSQAKACLVLNENKVALQYCTRAITISATVGDTINEARCLLVSARLKFFAGDLETSLKEASRAAERAEVAQDVSLQGSAYALAGYFCVASSDPSQIAIGISQLERSLTLLLSTRDKLGLVNSYNLLGNAQNQLGDFRDAWESHLKCRAISFECGSRSDEVVAVLNLAISGFEMGKLSEARQLAEEAERLSGRYQVRFTLSYSMVLGALIEVMMGDVHRGFERSFLALALVREMGNKYVEAFVLSYQIEVMLALGEWEEAAQAAKSLRAVMDATGNLELEPRLNVMLAELHLSQREYSEAEWRVRLAWKAAETAQSKGVMARALRIQAQLASAHQEWARAGSFCDQALALATRIGQGTERLHCLKVSAEIALGQGAGEATQIFATLREEAEQSANRLMAAVACFGIAAARPYHPDAPRTAASGREALEAIKDSLPENSRQNFARVPHYGAVLSGDYITASLPRRNGTRKPWLLKKLNHAF